MGNHLQRSSALELECALYQIAACGGDFEVGYNGIANQFVVAFVSCSDARHNADSDLITYTVGTPCHVVSVE